MGKAGRKSRMSCDQSGIGLAAAKQFVNGLPSRRFSSATNGGSEISHICGHVRRSAKIHIAPRARMVQCGYEFLERIENDIRHVVSDSTILRHFESLDDPTGWDNVTLD